MSDMRGELRRTYKIEAAHYLPRVHPSHQCHRMHGHNWEITIAVTGEVDEQMGWIVDFSKIDDVFSGQVHRPCDHRLLNEVDGLENPTSENFARWVWQKMWLALGTLPPAEWPEGARFAAVTVAENDRCSFTYRGE